MKRGSRSLDSESTTCAEHSDWSCFFRDIERIHWYTDYVCDILTIGDYNVSRVSIGPSSLDLVRPGQYDVRVTLFPPVINEWKRGRKSERRRKRE
jgi:hypothetical protein